MARCAWFAAAVAYVVLAARAVAADGAGDAPDWKPTEITRVSVGRDGGITLNGRPSGLAAFKVECKRLQRVDGAVEYVPSAEGDEPRTTRRVARIIIATRVSVRFVGPEGAVPADFRPSVPKVPL
jgi:hypothetical protein